MKKEVRRLYVALDSPSPSPKSWLAIVILQLHYLISFFLWFFFCLRKKKCRYYSSQFSNL